MRYCLGRHKRTHLTHRGGPSEFDLSFVSAYVFGAVCPSEGKAAALIMPICNTAAMNHHLCEI
jgi:hypothetical protein